MFHELNPDGYRNREYRPYILGEDTTYNTVLYDPYRTYNNGLYKTDYHVLQSYEDNVEKYFNMPRREPPLQTIKYPEGVLTQFQVTQNLENSFAPSNNKGRQGSYALLYST